MQAGNTHFSLFNLPVQFAIDQPALEGIYHKLQTEVHPDRFAAAPTNEKLRAMQLATQVNEAYQTLKKPLNRARYLLELQGVDTEEESNTSMPMDFLMQQMEWRENIEDASASRDMSTLDKLATTLKQEEKALHTLLASYLDANLDLAQAAGAVRKLKFIEKIQEEINLAIEKLED